MIDCHIIFNEATDRDDWLARCVASLQHPDIALHVHRFAESAPVNPRREAILRAHDSERWVMFADPDDYAHPVLLAEYVEFLRTVEGDMAWCAETVLRADTGEQRRWTSPHHLVALRGSMVMESLPDGLPPPRAIRAGEGFFPKPVYWHVMHGKNTAGGYREH